MNNEQLAIILGVRAELSLLELCRATTENEEETKGTKRLRDLETEGTRD